MTEKRFVIPNQMRVIRDTVTGEEAIFYDTEDGLLLKEWLNALHDENEQLKQSISKIDFAIIRKYDNSLENLLDEVYDGEYENWIKKQVSRAKKLDGDDRSD